MFTIVVNYHTITIASAPLTVYEIRTQGRIQGGGRPLEIGKNMNFWRKTVIFHTKYPNIFRASLRAAQYF